MFTDSIPAHARRLVEAGVDLPEAAATALSLAEVARTAQVSDPLTNLVDAADDLTEASLVDLMTKSAAVRSSNSVLPQIRAEAEAILYRRAHVAIRDGADGIVDQLAKRFGDAARIIEKHADTVDPDVSFGDAINSPDSSAWLSAYTEIKKAGGNLDVVGLAVFALAGGLGVGRNTVDGAAPWFIVKPAHQGRLDQAESILNGNSGERSAFGATVSIDARWLRLVRAGFKLRLASRRESITNGENLAPDPAVQRVGGWAA